jgi:hypothetical protein
MEKKDYNRLFEAGIQYTFPGRRKIPEQEKKICSITSGKTNRIY